MDLDRRDAWHRATKTTSEPSPVRHGGAFLLMPGGQSICRMVHDSLIWPFLPSDYFTYAVMPHLDTTARPLK